ncbi:hypothetical protein ACFFVB_15735 [Formosa undariae]|uniref:Glycosyltransferase family 1 protein n=1 Tax=Formosa undariae TaxID=1325436 RepID=A0ABV5F513_9FLAO
MIIYYFGSDGAWEDQNETNIRRRNYAILFALSKHENVTHVYNIVRCTRSLVFKNIFKRKPKNQIIKNIYIAPILPERTFIGAFSKVFNRWFLKTVNHKAFYFKEEKCVSWCYWPKGFLDWSYLGITGDMVFDTDHNIIDDPNIPLNRKIEREDLLLKAGLNAKLILSSSRSMLQWFNKHDLNQTKLVLNGNFIERMRFPLKKSACKQPQITYCGTLSKWMKIDWLKRLVENHAEWEFHIIGNAYKTDFEKDFRSYNNVTLYGFLEPNEVSNILQITDVALGLYTENPALDVNSMKLYDYLLNGVAIVINNYHNKLEVDFNGLISIANSFEDFELAVESAIQLNVNKKDLQTFLQNTTWEARIKPILNILND